MMPINRQPEPEILRQKRNAWTKAYLARIENGRPRFYWPKIKGKPLNHHLNPVLLKMTADHCSYCDGFPMYVMTAKTIDHFRPKERYPELVFDWKNLFTCCNACQQAKNTQFDPGLLKPDEWDYDFSDYFWFNHNTGEIEINPFAPDSKQGRARKTLEILDLNDSEGYQQNVRLRAYLDHNPDRPIEERAYRFMYLFTSE